MSIGICILFSWTHCWSGGGFKCLLPQSLVISIFVSLSASKANLPYLVNQTHVRTTKIKIKKHFFYLQLHYSKFISQQLLLHVSFQTSASCIIQRNHFIMLALQKHQSCHRKDFGYPHKAQSGLKHNRAQFTQPWSGFGTLSTNKDQGALGQPKGSKRSTERPSKKRVQTPPWVMHILQCFVSWV